MICWYSLRQTFNSASYSKAEWDKVTDGTITNAFIKPDLTISLDSVVTETFHNNKFLKLFKNFNTTATKQDIDEFVAIGDESSHVFRTELLEKANFFSK